ncbi:hypothetical protein ILYODFUR_016394 [Ilyodon furcidens]|uniref:Uncharacterized protein n=3 Tax=Goodeidae TaxID=28758 RepID=A0ABU7EW92_9TELE|nr:hypothetical protein [Characodon lateralis]
MRQTEPTPSSLELASPAAGGSGWVGSGLQEGCGSVPAGSSVAINQDVPAQLFLRDLFLGLWSRCVFARAKKQSQKNSHDAEWHNAGGFGVTFDLLSLVYFSCLSINGNRGLWVMRRTDTMTSVVM